MKTITSLFALLLATSPYVLADPPATQQTQREEKKPRTPEMDGLIKAIHLDLKELKETQPWLSGYDDKALLSDDMIFYMERSTLRDKREMLPQQPSQISIVYCRIEVNKHNSFKYDNNLEDVPACQFPTLKSKIYAHILVRGAKNAKTADAIRTCIIKRCEVLQEEMKREKTGHPQQNHGASQGSRKRD